MVSIYLCMSLCVIGNGYDKKNIFEQVFFTIRRCPELASNVLRTFILINTALFISTNVNYKQSKREKKNKWCSDKYSA